MPPTMVYLQANTYFHQYLIFDNSIEAGFLDIPYSNNYHIFWFWTGFAIGMDCCHLFEVNFLTFRQSKMCHKVFSSQNRTTLNRSYYTVFTGVDVARSFWRLSVLCLSVSVFHNHYRWEKIKIWTTQQVNLPLVYTGVHVARHWRGVRPLEELRAPFEVSQMGRHDALRFNVVFLTNHIQMWNSIKKGKDCLGKNGME